MPPPPRGTCAPHLAGPIGGTNGYIDLDSNAVMMNSYGVQFCVNCAVKIQKCAIKTDMLTDTQSFAVIWSEMLYIFSVNEIRRTMHIDDVFPQIIIIFEVFQVDQCLETKPSLPVLTILASRDVSLKNKGRSVALGRIT